MKFEPAKLLAKLPFAPTDKWPGGVPFVGAFSSGDFELEFFAPRGVDTQTPHDKDEFYIIVSGSADLILKGEAVACRPGDAVFVEKHAEHHFVNISDDFATWVIFF